MSVSWTAPGAQPGDWLALFRVGELRRRLFRYLFDGGFLDLARSSPVTVR